MKELIKTVTKSGNGAIVYVPSLWMNKKVLITPVDVDLTEELFELLKPNLKHVIGAYIYGSYSRDEQLEDSDVDILVIVDKKFELKQSKFDIHFIEIDNLKNGIYKNPIILYSIIREAKPVINQHLLKEFKNINKKKLDFSWFIESTKRALEINKKFLELTETVDGSFIYSIVLRARGIYLMKCILNDKDYTNKDFLHFIANLGFKKNFVKKIYNVYRTEKINKHVNHINVSFNEVYNLCLKLRGLIRSYEKRKKG